METKKEKIVSAVATIGIILTLFGATYAYFAKRVGDPAEANITLISHTTDLITFSKGEAIQFEAGQETFAEGKGNASGSTYVQATLTANSETNTATDNYSIYVIIDSNTFTYSLGEDIPEILLTITDDTGNVVTTGGSLQYKTVTDGLGNQVSGFDITNKTGLFILVDGHEITANPETIEKWTITMTFINYNENQNANAGKKIVSRFYIRQEPLEHRVDSACKDGYNLAECLTRLAINGDPGFSKLYYHDENLANGAGDNSARFAGEDVLVHNFVCFGSDEETCPDDNLYRIIGVFDGQVKLIKWDYATSALLGTDGDSHGACSSSTYCGIGINGGFYKGSNTAANIGAYWWNYDGNRFGTNTWSASELNTVNLNTNFINNIGSTWANKIADTTWKVGGNSYNNIVRATAQNAYKNEYINPAEDTTYTDKIGLMYVSDYGFAESPSAWTTTLNNYSNKREENWMYMGLDEWTVVRRSDDSSKAFTVTVNGDVGYQQINHDYYVYAVRPVFYLNSDVTYVSGSGTKSEPIRIN